MKAQTTVNLPNPKAGGYSPVATAATSGGGAAAGTASVPTSNNNNFAEPNSEEETEEPLYYRGGFATSICDLFQDPYDRSSCCAITCCGTFLQDRNSYLLTGEMPPPWWSRLVGYLGGLILSFLCIPVIAVVFPVLGIIVAPFCPLIYIVGMMIRASNLRRQNRRILQQRMMEQQSSSSGDGSNHSMIQQLPHQDNGTHSCLACIRRDRGGYYRGGTANSQQQQRILHNHINTTSPPPKPDFCAQLWNGAKELCCGICFDSWCTFCGMCETGQEHRQLRRLLPASKLLLDYITMEPFAAYYPAIEQLRLDGNTSFVSHLRCLSKLSQRLFHSVLVCIGLAVLAAALIGSNKTTERVVILVGTLGNAFLILYVCHWRYHRLDLSLDAVIKLFASGFFLATLTAMCIELIVGMIGQIVFEIVLGVELTVDDERLQEQQQQQQQQQQGSWSHYYGTPGSSGSSSSALPQGKNEFMHYVVDHHPVAFLVYYFFESFVVAALVEELAKYYSYFMIEHGDFIFEVRDPGNGGVGVEEDDYGKEGGIIGNGPPSPTSVIIPPYSAAEGNGDDVIRPTGSIVYSERPPTSFITPLPHTPTTMQQPGVEFKPRKPLSPSATANMITVAMMATATGFACSENLGYVFGESLIQNEWIVLVGRSLFPVHTLCAAIQSIGIVRRDVEKDIDGFGIGWAILPAVLLHGTFDFVMMVIAFFQFQKKLEEDDDFAFRSSSSSPNHEEETPLTWSELQIVVLPGLIIVMMGVMYYFLVSAAQCSRLAALDRNRPDIVLSPPFVVSA